MGCQCARVHMHGTPHQDLFDKAKRTQSSGCIRLRDPAEVAEILFASNKKKWTEELISQTIESGKTQWVALENPMPLFVVYWSVFMDEKKQLNFREDSYNYDGILIDAMNEPATLDTATIATPEPSESPP